MKHKTNNFEEKSGSEKINERIDDEKEKQEQLILRLIEEQIISYDRTIFQQSKEKDKYNYMFANNKVDYTNVDNILKFAMVYRELLRNGYDDVKYYRFKHEVSLDVVYDWGDIKNWMEIDESEYSGPLADYTTKFYYKITKEKIHEMANLMFEEDTLVDGDYLLSFVDECSFRNDEYFCHEVAGGGTGNDEYLTELDHYEFNDNNLVVYQKAYWIEKDYDTGKYNIAPSIESEILAQLDDYDFKFDEDLYRKYGRMYKSIFRKNSAGTYYWVSSEPVLNDK